MSLKQFHRLRCYLGGQVRSITSTVHGSDVRPFAEIPGPKGLPYLGTLFNYTIGPHTRSTYHKAFFQNYKKYGKIWKETIAGNTRVHLCDPDYVQTMYSYDGKVPKAPPLLQSTKMYREIRNIAPGLGNLNGEEWYRLRSAVQQMMLKPRAVTQFLPHVNECVDDFIARIYEARGPDGVVENFNNEILRWTLESSANTCFETRLGALTSFDKNDFPQKMVDANQRMLTHSLRLRFSIPFWRYIATPTWKSLVQSEDFFFGNAQRLVNETCAEIKRLVEKNELTEGRYGFMSYLLGKNMSYEEVSIIAMSLFSDGLSTTSPTTIGQLYCLATNPEAQDKLHREIKRVLGEKNQLVTAEHLTKLQYLKNCIKEGFRFFPIGTEVSRIAQQNIVIGGYEIPEGTHVEMNNNMLLRSEEYIEEPEVYDPDRWGRSGSASDIHPYLLIPFSFGPRMCAGKRFADQEMWVFVAKLVQNFRLEWNEAHTMEQDYRILLTPNCPANISFIPREL